MSQAHIAFVGLVLSALALSGCLFSYLKLRGTWAGAMLSAFSAAFAVVGIACAVVAAVL